MKNRLSRSIYLAAAAAGFFGFITPEIHAVAPNAPALTGVSNQGGPILVSFSSSTSGAGVPATYRIYRSTAAPVSTTTLAGVVAQPVPAAPVNFLDITATAGTNCYAVTAVNSVNEESGPSGSLCAFSVELPATGSCNITAPASDPDPRIINKSTETLTMTCTLNNIIAKEINLNVTHALTERNALDDGVTVKATNTVSFTWDGAWYGDQAGNKHNGTYIPVVTVTPYQGSGDEFEGTSVYVDVMHINGCGGSNVILLKNQTFGSDPPATGPPFTICYSLSKAGFVHARIRNRSSGVVVSTITNYAPRQQEFADWSKDNTEWWDGKDERGLIPGNDIYQWVLHAVEEVDDSGTRQPAASADANTQGNVSVGEDGFDFAFDVIRIVDVKATPITQGNSLAGIQYTLSHDATVYIQIALANTTFYLDAGGVPQAGSTSSVVQTLSFARGQGGNSETWDGTDRNGVAVGNGLYKFVIAAFAEGVHALDNSGNDRPIEGTIAVDRTASQTSSDSTAPSITGITVGGTSIALTGGTSISNSFSAIIIILNEASGTGSNATSVTLTDPRSATVSGTTAISGSQITFTAGAAQSSTGTYTLSVRPIDAVGNGATIQNIAFALTGAGSSQPALDSAAFKSSVISYPNPAKGAAAVTIRYTLGATSTVDLDVFNVLGEHLYHEQQSNVAAGTNNFTWSLANGAGTKVGSGIYMVRVKATGGGSTVEAVKKLIILQ